MMCALATCRTRETFFYVSPSLLSFSPASFVPSFLSSTAPYTQYVRVQRQTFVLRVRKYVWSERIVIRSQSSFKFIVICPHSIRDSIHIHFPILDIFSCRLYYTCKLAYRQNYAKHRARNGIMLIRNSLLRDV